MFINLIAPINPLGYGVVGYNVLKSLFNRGHSVSYWPIGNPEWNGDNSAKKIVEDSINNAKMYNLEAPSIRIWHQNQLDMFPGKGERIGWPIFELDGFNNEEAHHLSNLDRVFVCSKWAKEVVERQIKTRVDVIPLGVDLSVFFVDDNAKQQRAYWTKDSTIFINVGKWETRKGHDELLVAFNAAFDKDDNVELWMVNDNPFLQHNGGNDKWKHRYISSKLGDKIKIWPRLSNQHELRKLFSQVDWGVFPSHAEGWNLEILELMACGVPSIATNYSGHTEFVNNKNSILIEPIGLEKAEDGIWFHGDRNWCSYNIDSLIDAMKRAHELKQNNEIDSALPDITRTVQKFTWDNTIRKIEEAI